MVIQNPWEAAKQLSPEARKALTLSLIIENLMPFTNAVFAGTYAAWMVAGGQQLVNLEYLVAGLGAFAVAVLVGDRNLFKTHFALKDIALRLLFIGAECIPALFLATNVTVLSITLVAAMYPILNGYRAERNNIVWGRRPEALADRQSFCIRFHPFEMAIVALGGIIGMVTVPNIFIMAIGFSVTHIAILVLDIIQNRLVESIRISTGYDNKESE